MKSSFIADLLVYISGKRPLGLGDSLGFCFDTYKWFSGEELTGSFPKPCGFKGSLWFMYVYCPKTGG